EEAGRPTLCVADERMAQQVERDAELQSYAGHDRAISRSGVAVAAGLAVGDENLGERAVGEVSNRYDVVQPADFEVEGQRRSAVAQALAGHGPSRQSRQQKAAAPEQRFQDRPQVVDGIAARGFEAQEELRWTAASGWQRGRRAAANCLFEATARRGETRSAQAIANACWLCDGRHVEVL